jgi:hypothetical protein
MIPPAAQRAMSERAKATVTETPRSHAVYVSRPAVVAAVISQAAQGGLNDPALDAAGTLIPSAIG